MTYTALDSFTEETKPLIESSLAQYANFSTLDKRQELKEAIAYSLTAPAKRFRPLLCLATYQLFSEDLGPIMPLAAAIEMIHTYSLIHDDLPDMDNDDVRRGQATCHKVFGNDMAILAGDTLNSYAFEIVAKELPGPFSAEAVLGVITKFANACGIEGLAGGQALDLRHSHNETPTPDALENIHRRKTGALIACCTALPARLASTDTVLHDQFQLLGESIGLLFQIVDDILDSTQSSDVLGKTSGKDAEQDKLTFVALYGLDRAKQLAEEEAEKALRLLQTLSLGSPQVLEEMITYILRRSH